MDLMMLLKVKLQKMSKKDTSKNKKESTKDQENSNKEAVASVPLEDYEKIKDDYLRLAADFDNFKKRIEKDVRFLFQFCF